MLRVIQYILCFTIFVSCSKQAEPPFKKNFEGKIEYDVFDAHNYKWKYKRDCVIIERLKKEVVYFGRRGQIHESENETRVFDAKKDEAVRISFYKNRSHCSYDHLRRDFFRQNFKDLDSNVSVAGLNCRVIVYGEGLPDSRSSEWFPWLDGTYYSVCDSLPVNYLKSAYSLRHTDSVFKHVVLRQDRIWGWTREIRVATKVIPMSIDTVFARYEKIIDNDESLSRMKTAKFQKKYLFPGIILLLFLCPAIYMWRARNGWLAFFLSLGASIALVYLFHTLRVEEIESEPKRFLNLFRGMGANIKFTIRSGFVLLGYITFTIIYTVVRRKSKKQSP